VGICAVAGFLGPGSNIGTMLNHIDHVAKRFGADHAAIATDLVYSSRHGDVEWPKMPRRRRTRRQWEGLWPAGSYPTGQSPSLAWSNWPLFTVGLVQRGYSDDDIRKIIGGNAIRVARAALA
jgi:membrane dipeptidase